MDDLVTSCEGKVCIIDDFVPKKGNQEGIEEEKRKYLELWKCWQKDFLNVFHFAWDIINNNKKNWVKRSSVLCVSSPHLNIID